MPRTRARSIVARIGGPLALIGLLLATVAGPARADATRPPTAALGAPSGRSHHPISRPRPVHPRGEPPPTSAGWWLGTVGVALALAAFGGVSLASRRYLAGRDSGSLQVLCRASLAPKQAVYLLRAGGRVLIVGTGPQGAPALLGELTEPDELDRLLPRSGPAAAGPDRRIGGEP